ncbi:MAG TPA: hypothetical protein VJO32_07470, partial [Ktedonobacteraceae bacterium]|nr:hypothetical protein [Ktedonobacteraceae bacterium]
RVLSKSVIWKTCLLNCVSNTDYANQFPPFASSKLLDEVVFFAIIGPITHPMRLPGKSSHQIYGSDHGEYACIAQQ